MEIELGASKKSGNDLEAIRGRIVLLSALVAVLCIWVGSIGAFIYWPQWGGTFLGLVTFGVTIGLIWLSALSSRRRVVVLAVGLFSTGLISLFFIHLVALDIPKGAFKSDLCAILLVATIMIAIAATTSATTTLKGMFVYGQDFIAAFAGKEITSPELASKSGGSLIGNIVGYAGIILMASPIAILISMEMANTYSVLLTVDGFIALLIGYSFCKRDGFITKLALCTLIFVSIAAVVSGFISLNYLGSLSDWSHSVMILKLVMGIPVFFVTMVFPLVYVNRRLHKA